MSMKLVTIEMKMNSGEGVADERVTERTSERVEGKKGLT
jgi:hypothetical protein